MIAPVIVRFHEACQSAFEVPRAEVLLEFHDVLHRPVIAFDLPLRHRVIRRTPCVRQTVLVQVVREFLRNIAGAVIAEQARPMDGCLRRSLLIGRLHLRDLGRKPRVPPRYT